jgi:YD repeat-containing protein
MAVSCSGCGSVLDPSVEQVNSTVDQVLQSSLEDARQTGGVCPLCGHSKDVPYTRRPPVLFLLLVVCLVVGLIVYVNLRVLKAKQRSEAVSDAVARINSDPDVADFLGHPVTAGSGVEYKVKQDETGWLEAQITIPLHGPQGDGVAHVTEGRPDGGQWNVSIFDVVIGDRHKKVDLLAGRVVSLDANAYMDVHTQTAVTPVMTEANVPLPRIAANYPCVSASVGSAGSVASQLGSCALAATAGGPVDRFETDLRYGRFVMRETDLYLNDGFQVPLTRTYNSQDWVHPNHVHAFGRNTNHPYDIDPVGTRNPYTYMMIILEDGDFVYLPRISQGGGYTDAVYQHSESATRFYKALNRWNGRGWTTTLADGSVIDFPESYAATNMAQGAPTEMRNALGERLQLIRDGQRNLQEILTPHGHWIKFQYDALSRVTYASDDAGNWAKYEYTPDGMLKTAVLSSGRERRYTYDGDQMRTVTDEKGQMLVRNFYAFGELTEQKFGNGDVYSYTYTRSDNRKYVDVAHVTMPNGQVKDVSVGGLVPGYVRKD